MNAIEIRRVTKQFGSVVAVNDLSLEVPEGSIYGFIGPNGSGKTTTIRMIMKIILPDSGEIAVLGQRSAGAARDQIGYLPEERGLYKKMPFSGLDPVNARSLRDAVLELRRQGTTIVFSTHDMSTAERLCDRIFMIFKGHKVLDGTLDDIQARYGHDTIRLRITGTVAALDGLTEIESIDDHGNYQDVRVKGSPQAFLQELVTRTEVRHFEITKPSLHDIFVRISGAG
ncbi:MAG TPA: DUF4162 domain-containing protein [Vicinamibacterales bacterium]|nr:DUF4162 domain-containing protein [Vicinamibacterales bacterium]